MNQAMGEWLGTLAPWDVFSTWTFSRPVQVHGALFWARRHLTYLEKTAQQRIYSFLGVERGGTGGLLHVHALVGNVGHLKADCGHHLAPCTWGSTCCMKHSWPCGIARVLVYDPKQGAAHYVSKYITKQLAEWDIIGFPCTPQISLAIRDGG